MSKVKYIVNEHGCWVWQSTAPNGYPHKAHRRYYKKYKGDIPEGFQIDHLCRNRACVNPDHLEAVTQRENIHRGLLTKLSDADVLKIKAFKNKLRQVEIASMFSIDQGQVSRILNNKGRGIGV